MEITFVLGLYGFVAQDSTVNVQKQVYVLINDCHWSDNKQVTGVVFCCSVVDGNLPNAVDVIFTQDGMHCQQTTHWHVTQNDGDKVRERALTKLPSACKLMKYKTRAQPIIFCCLFGFALSNIHKLSFTYASHFCHAQAVIGTVIFHDYSSTLVSASSRFSSPVGQQPSPATIERRRAACRLRAILWFSIYVQSRFRTCHVTEARCTHALLAHSFGRHVVTTHAVECFAQWITLFDMGACIAIRGGRRAN